jgi:hypothetical protein
MTEFTFGHLEVNQAEIKERAFPIVKEVVAGYACPFPALNTLSGTTALACVTVSYF